MATFMFKLGTLALKTLAKPLADRFKGYVMTHPKGRQAALSLAQRLHRMEVTVARRADGKEGRAFIGDMTEERGVELASKIASEGFVFAVGAGLVGLEYERTRRKEEAKKRDEAAARRRAAAVAEAEREQLRTVNERQERRLEELTGRLQAVEAAVGDVRSLYGEIRRAATEAAVGLRPPGGEGGSLEQQQQQQQQQRDLGSPVAATAADRADGGGRGAAAAATAAAAGGGGAGAGGIAGGGGGDSAACSG